MPSETAVRTGDTARLTSARSLAGFCRAAFALLLLVAADLALRCGFPTLARLVGACPIRRGIRADRREAVVEEVSQAMARASVLYYKQAWCLQRAAATVWYLRWRGQPAQLVIGVRKIPFTAHAWAEIDGSVVGQRPGLRDRYSVIDAM